MNVELRRSWQPAWFAAIVNVFLNEIVLSCACLVQYFKVTVALCDLSIMMQDETAPDTEVFSVTNLEKHGFG